MNYFELLRGFFFDFLRSVKINILRNFVIGMTKWSMICSNESWTSVRSDGSAGPAGCIFKNELPLNWRC